MKNVFYLTLLRALCNELETDILVINGSDEGRFLDTVRNSCKVYASTVSLTSKAKHKVILIDEADNTTPDVQLLLRALVEEFQKNCRFIFLLLIFRHRQQKNHRLQGISLLVSKISLTLKK